MEAIAYNIEVVDQILLQLVHKFGIALPEQVGIAATVLADSCTHLRVEFCYGDEIYDQRVDVHELVLLDFEVLHEVLLQLDPVYALRRITYKH